MIQLDDIYFSYLVENGKPRQVLNGVSLQIQSGEFVAVMGANGSGKSTLIKCCNGLLIPTSGSVFVDELDASLENDLPQIRRLVGMIFQNPDNQIVSTTVEREIAFGLENLGMPFDQMHARVDEMLGRFDLQTLRYKSPHYLSGGEKQRLALAAVLAMQPKYLILDEPTSLLDPHHRQEIISILHELHRTDQVTVVLVTQFPEEAKSADRLLLMDQGHIISDAAPDVIFSEPERLFRIGLEPPLSYYLKHLLHD